MTAMADQPETQFSQKQLRTQPAEMLQSVQGPGVLADVGTSDDAKASDAARAASQAKAQQAINAGRNPNEIGEDPT